MMKKAAFTIIILFITLSISAQKVLKKFEYAYDLYRKEKHDSALYLFANIYRKGIGDKEILYRSYYFEGLIYLNKKDTASAREIFRDILSTDFESLNTAYKPSFVTDPFLQFKNNSCKILAELALANKDYKLSLRYIQKAEEEYPFQDFCGNAHISNAIYLARLYSKCYYGLGDLDKAIQVLLPYCLSNGFASTGESARELAALIKEKYSKEEIKKEVFLARAGLYAEQPDRCSYCDTLYYVNIFDTKAEVITTNYHWHMKQVSKIKGITLYQYFFDQEEFIKTILKD